MEPNLQNILNVIPFGIHYWKLGGDGTLIFMGANRVADGILHLEHLQFVGKTIQESFGTVNPEVSDAFHRIAAQGGSYSREGVEFKDPRIPGLYEVHAVQPEPQQVAVLFRNITKRVQPEASLSGSEQRYRDLVHEIKDGVFMTDEKGVLTFINRPLASMYGSDPPEAIIGRHILEFVSPESRDMVWETFRDGVRRKVSLGAFEVPIVRKDGSLLQAEINAGPHVVDDRVVGTRGVIRDITARKQAEEALRDSEERYRSLVELSPDAIAVHSDGELVFVNSKAVQMFGAKDQREILGRSIMDFVHPDYRGIVMARVKGMREEGIVAPPIEEKFVRLDGSTIEAEVAAMAFKHMGRSAILVVVRDISGRKKVEESLQKLVRAVEQTDEVIFMTDPGGTITYVNPAFERVYQYTKEETIGKTPRILKSGMSDASRYERFWKSLVAGQSVREEFVNKTKDGRFITVNASVNPIFGVDSTLIGFIAVQGDITDRKAMEEKLRQSEEQYRLITENVADLIAVLDLNGKRLYNSPSYGELLGDPERLRGSDSFREIHPEDRERIRQIFTETIRTGQGQRAEYRFVTKSGSIRHIESQGSVIRDMHGKPSQVVVVSRDVTETKALQEQFLRAQRMESIGTLAAGIAHDLNNVLSPILLSMDLLRSRIHDKDVGRILDSVEASAKRGSDIVKQVLTFGRGLAGESILVQPRHLIHEIEKIIGETFPKSITLRSNIPKGLWQVFVDPTQMHQVILNICVNARDAMPDGGELVMSAENTRLDAQFARMHAEAKPGPYVLLSISDTGTGIPAEIMDRIFDPFFTTKDVGKGTGLGLSTVVSIVKNHGGFVDVTSAPMRGSTFRVYLPAKITDEISAMTSPQTELPLGQGERVLVVDDEASIREIARETLETHGYTVFVASDGIEALTLFAQDNADVVLTDLMMPNLDGAATIRALRKINPSVKIIAMTGFAPENTAREIGVNGFLSKPYTAEKLLTLVSSILKGEKI